MRIDQLEDLPVSHIRPLASGASKRGGTRFAERWNLNGEQKASLARRLAEKQVGDDESIHLFVGALEYELAAYQHDDACLSPAAKSTDSQPIEVKVAASTGTDDALQAITRAARELASLIDELPDESRPELLKTLATQDEMQRGYDQRYLNQLQYEITRLASAAAVQSVDAPRPVTQAAAPQERPSEECLRLAGSLAHIFEECFEQPATPDPEGPFAASLEAIHASTGIPLPHGRMFLELALTPTLASVNQG